MAEVKPGPRQVEIAQLRVGDWFKTDVDDEPVLVKAIDVYPACTGHTHINGNACYPSNSMAVLVPAPVKKKTPRKAV